MNAEFPQREFVRSNVMREANKSQEIQMNSNVAGTSVTRPRVPFDDLLEEGVPQEHIELVLEMRRSERERLRENVQPGNPPQRPLSARHVGPVA
jgi:hypothetical protein